VSTSVDTHADVVIVGGGVIGVSIALELAQRGAAVLVLESRDRPGLECSYGNSGLIAPSHCIPLAAPGVLRRMPGWLRGNGAIHVKLRPSIDLARFGLLLLRSCGRDQMLRGLRTLRDLARASQELVEDLNRAGLDFGYTRRGVMNVCHTETAFKALSADARLLASEGFDPDVLTPTQARQVEPCLRDTIAGAVLWQEDAHCDPRRFNDEISRAAREAGAYFETGTRVLGFTHGAHRTIRTVETSAGPRSAQAVILAAGSWTARLARQAGTRIPLQPGKGYHVHLSDASPPVQTPMIFQESVFAATPMSGQLRLAGTMQFVGLDLRLSDGAAARLLTEARHYLDGLDEAHSYETWCGLRPCTPDSLPLVGRSTRVQNLYLATGHAMLGLTLAAVTARAISEQIVDGSTKLPVDPLAPARYGA
jgi:D-amino-acid dehydrogenase